MATTFAVEEAFDLPPAQLLSWLGEPEVGQARAAAVPELNGHLLSLTLDEGPEGPQGLRTAMSATMPVSWLGGMAGTPRLIRTEVWRRAAAGYTGRIDLQVENLPVTCSGSTRLEPRGGGSTLAMTLDLSVDVPVVGAMVEGKVADRIKAAITAELDALRQLAAGG